MTEILIPFALNKHGKQVSVDEVDNGLACECICISCKSRMIAKNNCSEKQSHFAHHRAGKADLKCDITFANSVFWMSESIITTSITNIKLLTPNLLSEYDNETEVTSAGIRELDVKTVDFFPKNNGSSWTFVVDVIAKERRRPLAITLSFDKGTDWHGAVSYKGKFLSNLVINLSKLHKIWRLKKAGFRESLNYELFENPNNRRWAFHERTAKVLKQLDEQRLSGISAIRQNSHSQNTMFSAKEQASLDQLYRELELER